MLYGATLNVFSCDGGAAATKLFFLIFILSSYIRTVFLNGKYQENRKEKTFTTKKNLSFGVAETLVGPIATKHYRFGYDHVCAFVCTTYISFSPKTSKK